MLRSALLGIFFDAGAVGNQSRCVCVYFYLCTVWMCVKIHLNFKSVHISVCVCMCVCSVYSLWEDVMSCLCSEICLKVCLYSGLLNASWPGTFKSYGSDLHELNALDSTMTNCKLCLTFVLWFC